MKMRLLTALIFTGCFSHMAMASNVTTGTIVNKTTATATVTLNQAITLKNTLTPVDGLKAGTATPTLASGLIANGKLSIQETTGTAKLALSAYAPTNEDFVTYATGHKNDSTYKLSYRVYPTSSDTNYIEMTDGVYIFTTKNVKELAYTVNAVSDKLPKAGSYTISVTGGIYNP